MKRVDREGPVHRSVLQYLRIVLIGNPIIFHPPSETRRPGRDGDVNRMMNAAMGVVPGIPDIICLTHHGALFFEVKAGRNGNSPAQSSCHADLVRLGYRVAVVRGIEDVRDALRRWGIPTSESHPISGELMP